MEAEDVIALVADTLHAFDAEKPIHVVPPEHQVLRFIGWELVP